MKYPVLFYSIISAMAHSVMTISYEPPENCDWSYSDSNRKEVSLFCNLRTIGSDFVSSNLSVAQSEHTTTLDILCSDVLFFQSSLQPRLFQRLYNLHTLGIQYCKLNSVPGGTFLGLDSLRQLTVSTHNSDWSAMALELFPDSLVGMPNLEKLDLGQNNIWNLPERVFCPLPALRDLNLTWNRLQDVSEVGVTGGCGAHLVTLDLSGNDLVVLPEAGLAGLQSLRQLYLQYNDISMLADGAFLGLTSLHVLNISSNRMVALPPQVFNETLALRELYLQNNSMTVLAPSLFSSLGQLTTLDMSHNELTSEWVSADTFSGLVRLMVLSLSHNKMTHITRDMFRDLSALQVLDLSHNDVSFVGDKIFSSLKNLHHLDLGYNRISVLNSKSLSGLPVLSRLSLSHNNITKVSPSAFSNCTNLHDLRLDFNHLNEVPEAVSKTLSLRLLRINHNVLTRLSEDELTPLVSLRHLDVSNNLLRGICKQCFANLTDLQVLDLSSNELGAIPHGIFDQNVKLELLRLDGNKMNDMNGLFASLTNLLWLNVSDNRITWFDYALIPVQLHNLDLHNNKIKDLGNYYNIQSKLYLRTLDASYNLIESLGPSSVPNSVELLFVNSNKINRIAPSTFSEKNNLSMVDLYDNLLSKLELQSINLPPVPNNKNLPEFYIGGNPIFCDCNMEWMHRVHQISGLRRHPRVMDLDKVTCTLPYPRNEENRVPFLETHASQFLCPYTSHCFALCQCCDFMACDCQMTCPHGCSCYHDDTWATNIVDCSSRAHHQLPDDIPMDATVVYIDGNNMPLLDAHRLIGRKNLRALFLNDSKVERIQNRTFHGLSSLKKLYLQDNLLNELEGFEFEHLEHLRELYLQNNKIRIINNMTFRGLHSLEILNLQGNQIVNFPVWKLKYNKGLQEITLGQNSWSCECNYMVDFKNWLIRQTDVVRDAKSLYCVSNSTGQPGPVILDTSYSCENFVATSIVQEKLHNDFLQPVLITLGIFFVVLILGVVLAMFRSKLHKNVSKKCSGLRWLPPPNALTKEENTNLLYDAFLSYSVMDAAFATEVFAPQLENSENNYKLCLSSRDYEVVGNYVGDFIINSIESSHKIILLLTKNFIDNDWCKFSFKAAHLEALKNAKNKIIVVMCGDVTENDLDSDLATVVKGTTKLKYEDKSFWSKLHASLPGGCTKISDQHCFIAETNYIMRNEMHVLSPTHTLKQPQLMPNIMLNGVLKPPTTIAQLQQQHQNQLQHHHQVSMSSDTGDLDRTFVSVETAQSSLAPSLSHSYMSIDYGSSNRNSHIYASIDEATPTTVLPPSTLAGIHHQHLNNYHHHHPHTLNKDNLNQHHQQVQALQQPLHRLQHQQISAGDSRIPFLHDSFQRRSFPSSGLCPTHDPPPPAVTASYFI